MSYSVMWSEKSEKLKDRLIKERFIDEQCIKVVSLTLDEVFGLHKQGYETLNDWLHEVLFDGKSAPYRLYNIEHMVVDDHVPNRVEVIVFAVKR